MPRKIVTERLVLRPFMAADSDDVLRYLGDYAVSRWLAQVPHPFTRADLRILNPDGGERWPELAAITLNGVIVGGIGTDGHFGYWVAQPFWGNGIATEAAGGMVSYLFGLDQRADINSGYFAENRAAGRVLEKLGFEETGRGTQFSRSQDREVPHVNMILSRDVWEVRS